MTDLEMTRLCAEAMGFAYDVVGQAVILRYHGREEFMPLVNDAQAMALVKKFNLTIWPAKWGGCSGDWYAEQRTQEPYVGVRNENLNRAIVECVSQLRGAKG